MEVNKLMKALKMLRFQGSAASSNSEPIRLNWYHSKAGMEMVQVAILIAIAIAAGLIFRNQIGDFINGVFDGLSTDSFQF